LINTANILLIQLINMATVSTQSSKIKRCSVAWADYTPILSTIQQVSTSCCIMTP
jgi:hypothetical protein